MIQDGTKSKDADPSENLESLLGAPVTITHLLVGLDWGGAERLLLDVLPVMVARGVDVDVVALGGDGPVGDAMRGAGMCATALGSQRKSPILLPKLVEHLRARRPSIIHTHLYWPGVIGRCVGRMLNIPLIISHEHFLATGLSTHRRLIESVSYGWVHGVVAVSDAVLNQRRKYIPSRAFIEVIPNAIDLSFTNDRGARDEIRAELGIPDEATLIGWVGRMDNDWKDLSCLVEAAAILEESMPEIRWVLVGGGPDETMIKRAVDKQNLTGKVNFTGTRSDARRFYPAMDVFVLPSKSEGSPMVIAEAMAAGVPVVAARVGGIPDLIDDGETGVLVEPSNPDMLASAIQGILADREKSSLMAKKGMREIRESRSTQGYVDKLMRFYVEAAGVR